MLGLGWSTIGTLNWQIMAGKRLEMIDKWQFGCTEAVMPTTLDREWACSPCKMSTASDTP